MSWMNPLPETDSLVLFQWFPSCNDKPTVDGMDDGFGCFKLQGYETIRKSSQCGRQILLFRVKVVAVIDGDSLIEDRSLSYVAKP